MLNIQIPFQITQIRLSWADTDLGICMLTVTPVILLIRQDWEYWPIHQVWYTPCDHQPCLPPLVTRGHSCLPARAPAVARTVVGPPAHWDASHSHPLPCLNGQCWLQHCLLPQPRGPPMCSHNALLVPLALHWCCSILSICASTPPLGRSTHVSPSCQHSEGLAQMNESTEHCWTL